MKKLSICLLPFLYLGCTSRSYTNYLVDTPVRKSEALTESGTPIKPYAQQKATTLMKVRWNDGQVFTEVEIPLIASGERVFVEHGQGVKKGNIPPSRIVPPPPVAADKTLADAYRSKGLKEDSSKPEVSISRTRMLMKDALANGNYALALEYSELVLGRYPAHPEFLRAKGSILLLMGEKEKAIEVYEQAEEIESDKQVKKKLEELRKSK
jgi:tetratricopeptide (TPR) repeat protein